MPNALNTRQDSFVKMMQRSADHAAHGMELLSKRDDAAAYFDAVLAAGLLDASNNPAPSAIPDKPGFVHIPYWRALDYLVTLARQADERRDDALAAKVLSVVQSVTEKRLPDGSAVDNHYTFWKFAEILGLVPLSALTDGIVMLVPQWLNSKYDRSLVAHALSDGAMKRLLASDAPQNIHRACLLLEACTAFTWAPEGSAKELVTVVDDFWLRDMFAKNIKTFGSKAGHEATAILTDRLRAVYGDKRRSYQSSLWRPAIETHPQNYDWRGAENCFVAGLRDVVLAWSDTGDADARTFVAALMAESLDILRRIGLHVIDERFSDYSSLIDPIIDPALFTSPYRHELYRLLNRHFADLSNPGKDAVIAAIRAIPTPKAGKKRALHRAYVQRDWASAIRQKDYPPADELFAQLNATPGLGEPSEHPDFLTYHESRMGPGPSPFTAEILITAAKDGTLREKVGGFQERDPWRGPTEEGMWSTLEGAVAQAPDVFVPRLHEYATASIPIIHSLIAGLRKSLEITPNIEPLVPRAQLWPALLDYFEVVLAQPSFWADEPPETRNLIARRGWVLSAMADTLASGTRTDATAYSIGLLPQGWRILRVLLARATGMTDLRDSDLMTQAINTPRGRVIEALMNHTLRVCRVHSRKKNSHAQAWRSLRPTFDAQLALCRGANFEFSVLMAGYLANLDYISAAWLRANFKLIFDKEYPDNFRCALAGLPYASPTRRVYKLLVKHGVLLAAFDAKFSGARELNRAVEFICLALLWGDEDLASPQFGKLFEPGREDGLTAAADWFWMLRSNKLTQKQHKSILAFWSKSVAWAATQSQPPKTLLSHLCQLAAFLTDLDADASELLEAVVPYAGVDYNFQNVVAELARLAPQNAAEATRLLGVALAANKPMYDMDDRLKNLLRFLAGHGQRVAALEYINQLMPSLPGMLALFQEITQTGPG